MSPEIWELQLEHKEECAAGGGWLSVKRCSLSHFSKVLFVFDAQENVIPALALILPDSRFNSWEN